MLKVIVKMKVLRAVKVSKIGTHVDPRKGKRWKSNGGSLCVLRIIRSPAIEVE